MSADLWPHQTQAIDTLRDRMREGISRPVLQIATGGGKTKTAAAIIAMARQKRKRVVFVVPFLSLIEQTIEKFEADGITDIGVIQGQHMLTDWSKPVQIASVQTLGRRDLPSADLVIVDECHLNYAVIQRWMRSTSIPFIGLSATPWARGLGKHYAEMVQVISMQEMIDLGRLSPFRVFAPSKPDLSKVRTLAGDFHEGDLSDAMDKPQLTADVVATWLRLGEDRPTLCFAVDRAHAKNLHREFVKAGVYAAYVDAYTEATDREKIQKAFHRGDVKVVVSVGTMTAGIDWDVRCIILARPTKSEMLYVQIIGRGLRAATGKDDCLILDHSDTTARLGFVTDIHYDELDTGKDRRKTATERERREALPKPCPACTFLKPAGVHKCPECGFAPERQSKIEYVEGDLVQLSGHKPKYDKATKQKWFSMLQYWEQERGYKKGWAARNYREKFGVWPQGLNENFPTHPDREVHGWITSKLIAYAKKKPKQEASQHAA